MNTILLIEDNNEIRENMAEILELSAYKVLTAENGKVGVELATEHKPDLIVCDIMMPVLDGYGVIHMLQKTPELSSIPFIFLTAKAERSEMRKGMELGADDYITKPFNGTELLNAIESRLKRAQLMKTELGQGMQGYNSLVSITSSQEVLNTLITDRSSSKFRKKQTIYTERNHPFHLFYIESGKVKTYKINDDGKELIIGLYSKGDFFGYNALLEGGAYKESAEGIEDCEIAMIPKKEFDDLLSSNRDVMRKFVQLLANNIADKEEQLLNTAYNSLRKKVADTLITVSKKYNTTKSDNFSIDITRENLANLAGTAKESFIRTLSDFKNENIIDIKHGDIVILDRKKLENLSN